MYIVIELKRGWAVQHTKTFRIVSTGLSELQAIRICETLNNSNSRKAA